MLIPLRTDRPPRRRAVVTEGLIILNLLVYLGGLVAETTGRLEAGGLANLGHFDPRDVQVWQLVSYQFLHDPHDVFHVAFNMLFLWVFGAPVEDRLRRPGFLCFYLLGGAVAALAHMVAEPAPVIGASGSVAAVTGAFLALFPRSRIKVLIFFFIIGVWEIPSLWFIAFFFAVDLLRQTMALFGGDSGNVAYMAHLAGYAYGFAIGFSLLATGVLKHEDFDIFFIFKQARRRAAFRAASRATPSGPWDSAQADTGKRLLKQAKTAAPFSDADRARLELRATISRLATEHQLPDAAANYRRLLEQDENAVFSEPIQLDLGNQLYAERSFVPAARAYELLLGHYPTASSDGQVHLLLGLIYARQLERPDRAAEVLAEACKRLRDPAQSELAETLLAEVATP